MTQQITHDVIIVGQGLAGSTLAWQLYQRGYQPFLIDQPTEVTASRIAAGLITPITGKRFVCAAEYQDHWTEAQQFYPAIETTAGHQFFEQVSIVRLFRDEDDLEFFRSRRFEKYEEQVEWHEDSDGEIKGFRMAGARLHCPAYLDVTRAFFEEREAFQPHQVHGKEGFERQGRVIQYTPLNVSSHAVVFCQGFAQKNHAPFPLIPDSPCRGDILRVKIPDDTHTDVLSRGIWLIPESDGTYLAGSTYDWETMANVPKESGRRKILSQLRDIVRGPVEVLEHYGGVRPAMKNARPVWYHDPQEPSYAALNGLGARGTLWAPRQANQLIDSLIGREVLPERGQNHLATSS